MVSLYAKTLIHELYIVIRYSAIPALIVMLLTYISWDYTTILALLKLVAFVRIIHNEDQKITSLHFRYIFVKFAIVVCVYYLTYAAVLHIQANYLPDMAYHISSTFGSTKVSVPLSKANSMMLTRNPKDFWPKTQYFGLRILLEYLSMCNAVSEYRLVYLGIIFIVYGTFQIIMWYYFPERRGNESCSGSSTDSDTNETRPSSKMFVEAGI